MKRSLLSLIGLSLSSTAVPAVESATIPLASELAFERNVGQMDSAVRFAARDSRRGVFVTERGMTIAASEGSEIGVASMELVNPRQVSLAGESPAAGTMSYVLGNDPRRWVHKTRRYSRVAQPGVYPGVDLVYYVRDRNVEYDFVVAPNADPTQIRIRLGCEGRSAIDSQGDWVCSSRGGEIRQRAPIAFQEIDGTRVPVSASLVPSPDDQYGFALGPYDRTRQLTIDPQVVFASYIDGSGDDDLGFVTDTPNGNVLLAGSTTSMDFPTPDGGPAALGGGEDGVILILFVDFDPATGSRSYEVGQTIVIGGDGDDEVRAVDFDSAGNMYAGINTTSTNFGPATGEMDIVIQRFACQPDSAALSDLNRVDDAVVCIVEPGPTELPGPRLDFLDGLTVVPDEENGSQLIVWGNTGGPIGGEGEPNGAQQGFLGSFTLGTPMVQDNLWFFRSADSEMRDVFVTDVAVAQPPPNDDGSLPFSVVGFSSANQIIAPEFGLNTTNNPNPGSFNVWALNGDFQPRVGIVTPNGARWIPGREFIGNVERTRNGDVFYSGTNPNGSGAWTLIDQADGTDCLFEGGPGTNLRGAGYDGTTYFRSVDFDDRIELDILRSCDGGETSFEILNFKPTYKLGTSGYDAEYGRAQGGVINVVVKSTSNDYLNATDNAILANTRGGLSSSIVSVEVPKIAAITNNSDFSRITSIAPLQIANIFAIGFGPFRNDFFSLTQEGKIPKQLEGFEVVFCDPDNRGTEFTAATLFNISGQVAFVTPAAINSLSQVDVKLRRKDANGEIVDSTNAVRLAVVPSQLSFFRIGELAAAVRPDGSVVGRDNPIQESDGAIVAFGSGAGLLDSQCREDLLFQFDPDGPLPNDKDSYTAELRAGENRIPLDVSYVGYTDELSCGSNQVNALFQPGSFATLCRDLSPGPTEANFWMVATAEDQPLTGVTFVFCPDTGEPTIP